MRTISAHRWVLLVSIVTIFSATAAVAILVAWRAWDPRPWNNGQAAKLERAAKAEPDQLFATLNVRVRSFDADQFTASTAVEVRFHNQQLDRTATSVAIAFLTPYGTIHESVPIDQVDLQSGSAQILVALPIRGNPQSYPQEWYDLQVTSAVQLVRDGESPVTKPVPSRTVFSVGSGLAYWRPDEITGAEVSDTRISREAVRFDRPLKYYGFVYGIAAAPVLLILFYFGVAWVAPKSRSWTSHFELGLALLSIVTLRQVFVPSSISTLTRLDHVLGLLLLGSLLITTGTVWLGLREAHSASTKIPSPAQTAPPLEAVPRAAPSWVRVAAMVAVFELLRRLIRR